MRTPSQRWGSAGGRAVALERPPPPPNSNRPFGTHCVPPALHLHPLTPQHPRGRCHHHLHVQLRKWLTVTGCSSGSSLCLTRLAVRALKTQR